MSSEFIATIAFMPTVEGEELPRELRSALINSEGEPDTTLIAVVDPEWADESWSEENDVSYSSVSKDSPDYIEIVMHTKNEPNLEWVQAVSATFPTVKVALRGGDVDYPYSEYLLIEAGEYDRYEMHDEPDVEHLNQLVLTWGEVEFLGDWTGMHLNKREYGDSCMVDFDANVAEVITNEDASAGLLWSVKRNLELTPEQTVLVLAHPNHDPNFVPNENWWLGKS
jgi:hypothetical protein